MSIIDTAIYYENLLTKKIDKYSKEKCFFYNQGCPPKIEYDKFTQTFSFSKCKNCQNHYMCFYFFEEFLHYVYTDPDPYDGNIYYKPNQTFNYYLLIKESFYKKFKKMNLWLSSEYMCSNNGWNYDVEDRIFPDIAKFIKGKYSKKRVNHDGINYISLKLRALRNTLIPKFCLSFEDDEFKNLYEKCDTDNILIMAKPVKTKYYNMVILGCNIKGTYKDKIQITPKLFIEYNHNKSDYYSEENISVEQIENILEDYNDKKYYNSDIYDFDNIYATLYNEETGQSIDIELIEFYKLSMKVSIFDYR